MGTKHFCDRCREVAFNRADLSAVQVCSLGAELRIMFTYGEFCIGCIEVIKGVLKNEISENSP